MLGTIHTSEATFWVFAEAQLAAEQVGDVGTNLSSVQIVSLLVSTVLPILVGIVTKASTSGGPKAALLALFTAISGFGTEFLANSDSFNLTAALLTWLTSFMVAVATHYGVWKPTGVSDAAQETGNHD